MDPFEVLDLLAGDSCRDFFGEPFFGELFFGKEAVMTTFLMATAALNGVLRFTSLTSTFGDDLETVFRGDATLLEGDEVAACLAVFILLGVGSLSTLEEVSKDEKSR